MKPTLVTFNVFFAALLVSACGTPKPTTSAADVSQTSEESASTTQDAEVPEPVVEDEPDPLPPREPPITTEKPDAAEQEDAAPEPDEPETVADRTDLDTYVVPQGPSKTFKIINENLFQINACYMRELTGENQDMKGLLEIEFTVNMKGSIVKAHVTKNALNEAVADCVIEELKKLQYPKPKYAPETFRFPFTFIPAR